jgi:2-polyprenyl-3-methyl-5-hydroxy-6-metoxy-1,4-benzoquinol methylase
MTDPAAVARVTAAMPRGLRLLQRLRPLICPCDRLLAAVPPGARVLDVGCGAGLILGLLADAGRIAEGTGIDAGTAAIAAAATIPAHGRLRFIAQDAAAPWPEGRFDAVLLIDLLHHLRPAAQRAVVAQAAAALAPGGLLIIKDMAVRPRWMATMNRLHDLVMARQWIHQIPGATIASWCHDAGLVPAPVERFQRWWYAHELVTARRP